jgi:hypothetical protein
MDCGRAGVADVAGTAGGGTEDGFVDGATMMGSSSFAGDGSTMGAGSSARGDEVIAIDGCAIGVGSDRVGAGAGAVTTAGCATGSLTVAVVTVVAAGGRVLVTDAVVARSDTALGAMAGGGTDRVAAGRPTASGDRAGVVRCALGGGTRIDGDGCAGGGLDATLGVGDASADGVAIPTGFAASTSIALSDGTFGAAGNDPNVGVRSTSSPGSRTAGMDMLDCRRARAGGALAMNTSRFGIACSGVQCCPSGESSSSRVILPSVTHARSSPLFGSAARDPLGRRTFHGR